MKSKSVKILGKKFKITFVKPSGLNEQASGRIVNDLQTIVIDKTNHRERQREVLVHEIVHSLDFLLSLGLGEENTNRLGAILMAVIRQNPKVMRWIAK